MQYVNLLCAYREPIDLREFAAAFFSATKIVDGKEHESSNYLYGCYFKGSIEGIDFTVSLSDEGSYEDLPYWVHVKASMSPEGALEDTVNRLIDDQLLGAGFRVAKILNFGKRGQMRIDVTLERPASASS